MFFQYDYYGDYALYGDFVASEDGYSTKKKKKKKKKGKKKVIEICGQSTSGVFAFLAAGTLMINISFSFMFSLMVDIMISGTAVGSSVTVTNNNNNNNNNNNMNMNMNTNARRRKRADNTNIVNDELKQFIKELNAPQFHISKCSEEKILTTFGLLQLLYNENSESSQMCRVDDKTCEECKFKKKRSCDCQHHKLKKHYRELKNVCDF